MYICCIGSNIVRFRVKSGKMVYFCFDGIIDLIVFNLDDLCLIVVDYVFILCCFDVFGVFDDYIDFVFLI